MTWTTLHTTTIEFPSTAQSFDVEIEAELAPAEHDVGIMCDYVDDWKVTSVDGHTHEGICRAIEKRIAEEIGDEKFLDRLYDEGITDDGRFDGYANC